MFLKEVPLDWASTIGLCEQFGKQFPQDLLSKSVQSNIEYRQAKRKKKEWVMHVKRKKIQHTKRAIPNLQIKQNFSEIIYLN